MNRICWAIGLLAIFLAGCNEMDIVTTQGLKTLTRRCIHIKPIQSQDPYVGQVLSDVIEKEFVKKKAMLCDEENATIIVTGSTFMTMRSGATSGSLRSRKSAAANEALESVSLLAKDQQGQILLTASYDNTKQRTAGRIAKKFGSAIARKLK